MQLDPSNKIVQLCGEGMMLEGEGKMEEAKKLFQQAWNESSVSFEKCISAHYMARHQKNIADKLANSFCYLLPDDGYGTMIRGGIANGLARIVR